MTKTLSSDVVSTLQSLMNITKEDLEQAAKNDPAMAEALARLKEECVTTVPQQENITSTSVKCGAGE